MATPYLYLMCMYEYVVCVYVCACVCVYMCVWQLADTGSFRNNRRPTDAGGMRQLHKQHSVVKTTVCCQSEAAAKTTKQNKSLLFRQLPLCRCLSAAERWGAGVETQKNVRGEIGGWGRVPFNETYAPSLSTIYDGA